MYVIVTYDADKKRDAKIHKICSQYLFHKQRSVFEGVLTESKLNALKKQIRAIIDHKTDSFVIYILQTSSLVQKEEIGVTNKQNNIL